MKDTIGEDWTRPEDALPPPGMVVWIRRTKNKVEDSPVYIGKRNGDPLSTDPDASRNCHWNGGHVSTAFEPNERNDYNTLRFTASFSDVTVVSWKRIDKPVTP